MSEKKLSLVKIIRLSFLCFFVLGILFITNGHNPTVTAQKMGAGWQVALEEQETNVFKPTGSRTMSTDAHCFCKISIYNLVGQINANATGVILDLTNAVNKTYTGPFQQSEGNQKDCCKRCKAAAASHVGSQSLASAACAAGATNGTLVKAYSAVGTKEYRSCEDIGTLINTKEVKQTICNCPKGWLSNTNNTNGGITADGKCKKIACAGISILPLPPNGTPVGTWGFIWGSTLYAWGTAANGGTPNCVTSVVSPAVCKFQ